MQHQLLFCCYAAAPANRTYVGSRIYFVFWFSLGFRWQADEHNISLQQQVVQGCAQFLLLIQYNLQSMKLFFPVCFIAISIAACHSSEQQSKVVTMNAKDINLSPVVHDRLTADQMVKVRRIQKSLAEVYPVPLDETITNFKRDQDPGKEIAIWLKMASAYEKFISKHPQTDFLKKQEAFKLVLLRSMMADREAAQEAGLKALSKEEIGDIFQYYNAEAMPLTIRQH